MGTNPKPQLLLTSLKFGESPRWHSGRLWVSDWGTRELIAVSLEGKSEVMVKLDFPSFQPICMDWLPDGRLLIVSSGDGLCWLRGTSVRKIHCFLRTDVPRSQHRLVQRVKEKRPSANRVKAFPGKNKSREETGIPLPGS
jgi:sugar lactone lactonase YvrE